MPEPRKMKTPVSHTLRNGLVLPQVGYGTFGDAPAETLLENIKLAIRSGYRQLDTASIYKNEAVIGAALRQMKAEVPRAQIIVSSKVWNPDQGYDNAKAAFQKSLDELGLDYLDIYLIHWPVPYGREKIYQDVNYETWRAFEELYDAGKVRAIGVSNFLPRHLQPLMDKARIQPMINQIEVHPGYHQADNVAFCQQNGLLVQAWSPFMRGGIFEMPVMRQLAAKYEVEVSQVALQWLVQQDIQPLPKASSEKRMLGNLNWPDFTLTAEDLAAIATLDDISNRAPFKDYELQENN